MPVSLPFTTRQIAAIIGICAGLFCALAAAVLLALMGIGHWWGSLHESPTFTYGSSTNAIRRGGATPLGWIPDFLPPSAKNIREKRNGENGTSIITFEFDAADFSSFTNGFVTVPKSRFKEIRPYRIYNQEPWFPKVILRGDLHKLVTQGFTIYQTPIEYSGQRHLTKKRWYVAVNSEKGVCYMWRRYVED